MEAYNKARLRVVENATLLWSLTEVPEDASECPRPTSLSTRILTFDQEKQLADDFAFLAYRSVNPQQVKAVGIEQDKAEDRIIIRVASNTGGGGAIPELQSIANIMMSATEPGITTTKLHDQILSQIVHVCRARILSRLRSRHVGSLRKKNKPCLAPFLLKTVRQHCRSRGAPNAHLTCERLDDLFKQLEECEGLEEVERRIKAVLVHVASIDINELTKSLDKSKALDPSTAKYFPDALRKLARYHRIARDLINAARTTRFPHFRRISVEAVVLNSVDSHRLKAGARGFTEAMRQAVPTGNHRPTWTGSSEQKYRSRLAEDAWKVHAEIQILLYYELNKCDYPPRIICASKSACYLCCKFVQLHGKFVVPRTHGRLYDKWTLPDAAILDAASLHRMTKLILVFNQQLLQTIRRTLQHSIPRRAPPNESVAMLYACWSSHSTIPVEQLASATSSAISSHSEPGPEGTQLTTTAWSDSTSTCTLTKGDCVSMQLRRGSSFSVSTDAAHFQFDVSDEWAESGRDPFQSVSIEYLDPQLVSPADTKDMAVVDANTLDTSVDTTISFGGVFPSRIACLTQDYTIVLTFGRMSSSSRSSGTREVV